MKKELRNLVSQTEMKARLMAEPFERKTVSFYAYHPIESPREFRDFFYENCESLQIFGRIYIAGEGINAQISVPTHRLQDFRAFLDGISLNGIAFLRGVRLNFAVCDDGKSFWILKVKVREKIVADGIEDPTFSVERRGQTVNAARFNALCDDPETIVVDMRNSYEYEIGHFEGALEIRSDTFREQLPKSLEILAAQREKTVAMYCTGGIRCEKASAYLLHHGFKNVYHLEGGILEYVRTVREQSIENRFRGTNFVFDGRMGEAIDGEILGQCAQCGESANTHENCANDACHALFIQCQKCRAKFAGCCCQGCQNALENGQNEKGTPGFRKRFFD